MSLNQATSAGTPRNAHRALQFSIAALVVATLSRCLHAFGAPGLIDFVHIPFVLAAVAVSTAEIRRIDATRKSCFWVGLLFVDGVVAAIDAGSAIIRPVAGWLLLAEPALLAIAVVAALVSLPALEREVAKRRIENVVILIALLQLPFALVQASVTGVGDHVQGTFIGLGSGAHIAGAVALVGAIALCARAIRERRRLAATLALAGALFAMMFVADAKQVLLAAVPAIVVLIFVSDIVQGQSAAVRKIVGLGVLAAAGSVLLFFAASYRPLHQPGGEQTVKQGPRGKIVAFDSITADMRARPETYFVGLGAGNTVGKLATLTVGAGLKSDSPVAFLHLKQSDLTAEVLSLDKSNYVTASSSVWSGLSSVLGIFGDFGMIGVVAYISAWYALLRPGRRSRGSHRAIVLALVVLAGLLGIFHIWLEEPNIMLPLAALFATAVTPAISVGQERNEHRVPHPLDH